MGVGQNKTEGKKMPPPSLSQKSNKWYLDRVKMVDQISCDEMENAAL